MARTGGRAGRSGAILTRRGARKFATFQPALATRAPAPQAAVSPGKIAHLSLNSLTVFATNAGDSGVLLPVALVSAAVLWFLHSRRLAWLQLRSVLVAAVAIGALKLWFLSCGAHWFTLLSSPSGHSCMSAVVYLTLAGVLARGQRPPVQLALYALALLIVAVVGVTRILLGVHTAPEVLVGTLVGAVAFAWFHVACRRLPAQPLDRRTLAIAVAVTVLVAYGVRLPAESLLRHLARRLGENCALAAPARHEAPAAPAPAPN